MELELAIVEAYLAERAKRRAEMFVWIAEVFESAFEGE
jgi:hypothetical protein